METKMAMHMVMDNKNRTQLAASIKYEKGASFPEIVLMLPVALAVIYGLIYFSFALVYEGVAESTVHSALKSAIIMPDLDLIPETMPNNCDSKAASCKVTASSDEDKFCCALSNIKRKLTKSLSGSILGNNYADSNFAYFNPSEGHSEAIRITIPQDDGKGLSASDNPYAVLREKPITIELDYALKPLVYGLPPVQRTIKAAGYYEVQSAMSYPVPIDCMGNPYGSPEYNLTGCNCLETNGRIIGGRCRSCRWGAQAFLEGHAKWGGTTPEGYRNENPHYGCWCPTSENCEERLNNSAGAITWTSGTGCGCQCSWYRSFTGDGNGGCRCTNDAQKHVSDDNPNGTWSYQDGERHSGFKQNTPTNNLQMNPTEVVNGECRCTVAEEVSVTYPPDYFVASKAGRTETAPAGANFSQLHCDYLHGPGVTKQEGGGCECTCRKPSCPSGTIYFRDSSGSCAGSCQCLKPVEGSQAPNPKKTHNGTSCVCDASRDDVDICGPFEKYTDHSCECECDRERELEFCGSYAHLNGDCQCACNDITTPYTDIGNCPDPREGEGGFG